MCVIAWTSGAVAQNLPADNGPEGSLSLARAIELTQAHNPSLAAFPLESDAAGAAVDSAALRPPISVGADLENFAGSGEAAGTKSLEATLSLSTVLELGNKRSNRRSLATRELERLDVEQQARRLDALAEVARRHLSVVVAQEQVNLAADDTVLARQALDAVSRRVSAGASAELDRYGAQTRLARAELDERRTRSALDAARVKLAVLWGEERPRFAAASGNLFSLPALASLEQLRASLDRNPDLLRFASEARVREAALALARAQSRPDIDLSAGVRRLEDLDAEAFVLSFSMPLGSTRRSEPAIRGAQSDLGRLALEERAARLELYGTLYGLSRALDQARDALTALRGPVLEQALKALEQAQRGYRAGRYAYLLLADAQTQLLEIRREAITAAAEYHLAALEIERLTGESMTRVGN